MVDVEIVVKGFMNQKSGNAKESFQIHCNTPEEFLELLWPLVQPHIEKQLLYNNETETFDLCHNALNQNDLHKFVNFQDKASKRTYEVEKITT